MPAGAQRSDLGLAPLSEPALSLPALVGPTVVDHGRHLRPAVHTPAVGRSPFTVATVDLNPLEQFHKPDCRGAARWWQPVL